MLAKPDLRSYDVVWSSRLGRARVVFFVGLQKLRTKLLRTQSISTSISEVLRTWEKRRPAMGAHVLDMGIRPRQLLHIAACGF